MAKKKHKIMTVADLYNFCVKNNFCHFSSLDDNEEICVQLPATFESEENFDKDKEGLTPFVAKAYHDHINLNKSEIKPEVLESTLPSAMLRPILASIVVDEETGEKDFGSHDFVIEEEDGNEIVRYIEQPVGVIFGENYIENDEDEGVNRAILHGYLFNGYCQDAVDIMNRRGSVACSVELSIREMSYNAADKVLTLDDFYVSGLTLLGASVKPGMRGSKLTIKDFCKKGNKTFSHSDEKLIEMLEQLNTKIDNLSNFTIQANAEENYGKEEQFVETNKEFEEVVEETVETVEETVVETEEVIETASEDTTEESTEEVVTEETSEETTEESTEETPDVVVEESVEETVEEVTETEEFTEEVAETETDEAVEEVTPDVGEDGEEDEKADEPEEAETVTVVEEVKVKPEKYSISLSDGTIKEFALSLDEINNALYMLVNQTYGETDNTYYGVQVFEDGTLIMIDWWNNKAFRQKFDREEDNFSLVGDRVAVTQVWVTEEEEKALNDMKANYASLVQFKADTENAELHAQREAILYDAKYSVLAEKDENNEYKNEAYAKLVSEMDNYSLTDLEKELKSVFADHITNGGQFAYAGETESKPTITKKLFANSTSKKSSRYGNLFNK